MNGYGLFVWSAFVFTLINFFALYIIINRQLIKENKNSASAIKTQDDEENRIDQAAASAIEASQKLKV